MKQQAQVIEKVVTKTVRLEYLVSLPKDYDPTRTWPLILFLHGMGERGSDVHLIRKHGIPKIVEDWEDCPFITVSPQCSAKSFWSIEVDSLQMLLSEMEKEYAVDKRRIYLTGLSMGGYGSWALAAAIPEKIAAMIPICGGGDIQDADRLRSVPTWVFHGAKDTVVPLSESEKMVDAVKAAGGDVKFTVYPEADHDSWTVTYENPEIYTWLLSHSKG